MPKTGFKMKGGKGMMAALDPVAFAKASKRNMRRATLLNGKLGEAAMRKTIQGNVGPGNAALTQAIKGDSKALVDSSELFQAITSKATDDTTAFVGVLRTNGAFNVAEIVHDGITITVTPAMRGMFFFLWKASVGEMDPSKLTGRAAELFERFKDWRPLKSGTTSIVVPARPFADLTFADRGLQKQAKTNWQKALKAAFAERAQSGKAQS